MLSKTSQYLVLTLAVVCFAICGEKNREKIQIETLYAELCIIEMINIYLSILRTSFEPTFLIPVCHSHHET